MSSENEAYEYVLYVDEAGDDGLTRVRPIDPVGGSEWLCIGGVLIRASNEAAVVGWVKEIRENIKAAQGPALHFRNLSPTKKSQACDLLASKPLQCFVVCSNKKNMRRHANSKAAQRGGKQWYYNFCVRLLMERVTEVVLNDSLKNYGKPKLLKVVFSQRGGHSYGQTKAYWQVLRTQAAAGTTYLQKRQIRHEVLRFNLVDYVPHTEVAGCQLADIVASAFYSASDTLDVVHNLDPAKQLAARMARSNKQIADFGVVLQPTPPWAAKLTAEQKQIFEFYGYKF